MTQSSKYVETKQMEKFQQQQQLKKPKMNDERERINYLYYNFYINLIR